LHKKKILIIESDTRILFAFSRILENEGCDCLAATSIKDVENQIAKNEPCAFFVDISGSQAEAKVMIDKLTKEGLQIPLFIITSCHNDELQVWADAHGVIEVLEKPLSVATIRNALKKIDLQGLN
jgi:DNA-binding NtrC family response regulator